MIDVSPVHLETVRRILSGHVPECEVRAFGSRVTWTAKDYSDLDLAVVGDRVLDSDMLRRLKEAFEESDLPFRVDVLDWHAISDTFRKVIEKKFEVIQEGKTETRGGAGEWTFHQVGDLIESGALVVGDGYRAKNSELTNSGLPFARAGNVNAGFLFNDADCFPEENVHLVGNKVSQPGDVVFTSKGTVGRFGFVRPETPRFVYSPQLCFWRSIDRDLIDPRFLSFWMFGREFFIQFKGVAGQTDMAEYVSLTDQRRMHITLPSLPEQRAIAHILGTLDDKIELNRRMNETLEAIARALFKSWFVDFDPVRAKAEGRDPCLPNPIANLFPDSFDDSELGEIPKGWEVGKLGDVLAQRVERCIASSETAARPYVPIDCISPRSLFLTESKPGEEAQSSLTKFYKGDLLFGAMRPYFHKVCIAPFDGTTRTTAFVLTPKAKEDFAFVTLLLHHPDTIDYATRHSTGSTIPYAVWVGSLEEMPVIVPPSAVRIAFNMTVRPILDRIPVPHFQSKTLATLRDALLLKLISGEIRIEDVGRFHGRSTT